MCTSYICRFVLVCVCGCKYMQWRREVFEQPELKINLRSPAGQFLLFSFVLRPLLASARGNHPLAPLAPPLLCMLIEKSSLKSLYCTCVSKCVCLHARVRANVCRCPKLFISLKFHAESYDSKKLSINAKIKNCPFNADLLWFTAVLSRYNYLCLATV